MSTLTGRPERDVKALRGWWMRWRFRLSVVFVLIPVVSLFSYFDGIALNQGAKGLGEREVGEYAVGPWTVRLAEWQVQPPFRDGDAGYIKTFALAVYIRVGKPRSLRAAGGLFFGTPYRQLANLPIPERTEPGSEVWITVEGWDGSVHQTAVALAEVSPVTVDWLKKRGGAS